MRRVAIAVAFCGSLLLSLGLLGWYRWGSVASELPLWPVNYYDSDPSRRMEMLLKQSEGLQQLESQRGQVLGSSGSAAAQPDAARQP